MIVTHPALLKPTTSTLSAQHVSTPASLCFSYIPFLVPPEGGLARVPLAVYCHLSSLKASCKCVFLTFQLFLYRRLGGLDTSQI